MCTGSRLLATANVTKCTDKTCGQVAIVQTSPVWYAQRKGRITASIAHGIYTQRVPTQPDNMLKKTMRYDALDTANIPACKWGINHEREAREDYSEYSHE